MFRNVESHFAHVPQANIPRSVFKRPKTHTTSFNFADLVPIYVDTTIMPGDSVKMQTSKIVRLQTLLNPVMGDMYLDVYWFFVPHRLVWQNFKRFMGETIYPDSSWVQQTPYVVPTISAPSGGFSKNTLADYFGWPLGVDWNATDFGAPTVFALRSYAMIADQFFRDENVTDPLNIPTGDSNQTGTNGSSYINDVANGGMPFKVAKFHDYFTSCLPSAQKSANPVTFPLISGTEAPVYTRKKSVYEDADPSDVKPPSLAYWGSSTYTAPPIDIWTNNYRKASAYYDSGENRDYVIVSGNSTIDNASSYSATGFRPANLWADLSSSVGAVTVNELRLAFQLQKFYERQARSGSRYTEIIRSFFGVISPDARLQRPEYLGGNRIAINVHEVTNNAQTSTDFLGDLGAKSATADVHYDFDHSFTEHGTLIGLACARYTHLYSRSMDRQYLQKDKFDFFFPVFDALGEQPVYDVELYADATTMANKSVFGYQEAWAHYRFSKNMVTAEMRPELNASLGHWNLADKYNSKPTLSDGWIREDPGTIDRVSAVAMSNANQVFGDFYFDATYTRPMSVYSVPGLIDHF